LKCAGPFKYRWQPSRYTGSGSEDESFLLCFTDGEGDSLFIDVFDTGGRDFQGNPPVFLGDVEAFCLQVYVKFPFSLDIGMGDMVPDDGFFFRLFDKFWPWRKKV